MDDVYKKTEEYKSNKKRKILIVFDDMITDVLSNKNRNPIVTELFIRGRKLTFLLPLLIFYILFCNAKTYLTKLCILFYYENFKQTIASTNCI